MIVADFRMNKIVYLTSAVLLALSSCTNEIGEEGFVDKTNTISFSAYANKTRAVNGDVTSENMKNEGNGFGVVGYYNNSLYLGSTTKAVQQIWKNNNWEYALQSDLKFWPEGNMDFYAYFPYKHLKDQTEKGIATFSNSNNNSENVVMTIPDQECDHDVLFAKITSGYTGRVPLTFHHAFSKIQELNIKVNGGNVGDANVSVTVKKIEFINTSTSGSVNVYKDGKASYDIAASNVTLSKEFSSSVEISKAMTDGLNLISGTENRYLFATNSSSSEENPVKGTAKSMWNGTKGALNGGKLSDSNFVCLKLTCKVKDSTHYLVGGEDSYGEVYIPLVGSDQNSNTVTELLAGKRYTYKIIFTHNVGFKDNGDPILNPILFSVSEVKSWGDVQVTIEL